MQFENSWDNRTRAESYSRLEFPNTYYLAYGDLPDIIAKHVTLGRAVDFGCGTGRSTRFLKQLGFNVTGVDISQDMLDIAKKIDITGDYQLVTNGHYEHLGIRTNILKSLSKLMNATGRILCLDSTPELYINEWASFSTKDFPENRVA